MEGGVGGSSRGVGGLDMGLEVVMYYWASRDADQGTVHRVSERKERRGAELEVGVEIEMEGEKL